MEENLGPGGYNAMHSHGEITTKVLQSDEVQIGDPVWLFQAWVRIISTREISQEVIASEVFNDTD